jgi:hypothetical protein
VQPVIPSATLRRCAGAVAALVLGAAVVGATAGPVAAQAAPAAPLASAQIADRVRALDQEVRRVGVELTAGVERYEQAQDHLARLTQGRMAARDDVEARRADAVASRAASDRLARAAYKGTVPPLVAALLSGDPRTLADLAYVQRSVSALGGERREQAERAEQQERTAGRVLARSDADRRHAVVLQQVVEAELAELRSQTTRLSDQLALTADALVAARADEAARALAAERARQAAAARAAAARRQQQTCPRPPLARSGHRSRRRRDVRTPEHARRGQRLPARLDAVPAVGRPRAPAAHRRGPRLRAAAGGVRLRARSTAVRHRLLPQLRRPGGRLRPQAQPGCGPRHQPARLGARARPLRWRPDVRRRGARVDAQHAPDHGWHHPRWARQGGSKPEPWHWEYGAG